MLYVKCAKFVFLLGLCPGPLWGAYSAPQESLFGWEDDTAVGSCTGLATWHDISAIYIGYPIFSSSKISDVFDIFKIGYFPYFFNSTLLLDVKTSLKCENRHFKFSLLLTRYYLILKHFYRTMHIAQSAVLLLLLFLVAPFRNIQLKHKPFNSHHPIQCCKISKISIMYRKYKKYQKCPPFQLLLEPTVTNFLHT